MMFSLNDCLLACGLLDMVVYASAGVLAHKNSVTVRRGAAMQIRVRSSTAAECASISHKGQLGRVKCPGISRWFLVHVYAC